MLHAECLFCVCLLTTSTQTAINWMLSSDQEVKCSYDKDITTQILAYLTVPTAEQTKSWLLTYFADTSSFQKAEENKKELMIQDCILITQQW